MTTSRKTFQIRHFYDFYEVIIDGTTIVSIIKLIGTSQYPEEISFSQCQEDVQRLILQKINPSISDV